MGKTSQVRRYEGQGLPIGCRIAVIANDALGNYVVLTPLLQMLHSELRPSVLHFFSGIRTEELWRNDTNVHQGFRISTVTGDLAREEPMQSYDLVVNIESSLWAKSLCRQIASKSTFVSGPCLNEHGDLDLPYPVDSAGILALDPDWTAEDLTTRHTNLSSPFMAEILCRLTYLSGKIPSYSVPLAEPVMDIPDVLISASASLDEKLWEPAKWIEVLDWMGQQGLLVGLLGARPSDQRLYWRGDRTEEVLLSRGLAQDLRGKLSLPQVVGALKRTKLCLTIDNGILHLAAAVQTPTVGLFRESFHRLWAPPVPTLSAITPGVLRRVAEIEVKTAIDAIVRALSGIRV